MIASTRDAVKERKKAVKASAAAADADGAKTYADAAAEGVEEVKEAVEQAKDGAAGKDADEALVKVKKAAAKALVRSAPCPRPACPLRRRSASCHRRIADALRERPHPQATAKDSSTVLQILSAEGLAGLYAGLSSSLVGIAVTNGVYYGAYSLASDGARKASPTGTTLTVGQSILAGVVAGPSLPPLPPRRNPARLTPSHWLPPPPSPRRTPGSATTLITNPLWVVQTHQATFTHLHPDAAAPSIGQSAHMIYKQGGAKAFWRGIKAALVLVANPVLQVPSPSRPPCTPRVHES